MRIFLSCFFFVSFNTYALCDFKSHVSGVVSLSGPTTVLLKEFGLLQNKKVKGISVFNPVSSKDFTGKVYPGGVFLSQGSFGEFTGQVVFYDESRELNRALSPLSSVQGVEIKTRNLSPHETVSKTIEVMKDFLTGCEKEMSEILGKVSLVEKKLKEKIPKGTSAVFYLGEFRGGRAPELVMVQDGVVKWMVNEKMITTYPTTLAYVNWSAKVMSELPKNTLHVGVKDSARDQKKEIKKSPRGMTFIYPGSLVPGLTQLEAFLYWAEATF